MMLLRRLQPPPDEIHLGRRRLDALLRFLLERMKHIDGARQFHGVDGSISVSIVFLDDLKHSRPAEPLQDLGVSVLPSELGLPQGKTHLVADLFGEFPQVFKAGAHLKDWF